MKEALRGKNILVADNKDRIRNIIQIYLERAGFEFIEAGNGEEARSQFLKYDPCFVILEVNLPNGNGTNVCDWIRNELNSNVPIILMGTESPETERINWLNKGADDFLVKPFSPSELVARVEAVLRRTANRCSKVSYRGLTLKPIQGVVKFEDHLIDLTISEYRLLLHLMLHPDQVLTREQLIRQIVENGEKNINNRTIDVHITHLRMKIGKYTDYPFIETIRGMGYKFNR